jgi:hypothetical protein
MKETRRFFDGLREDEDSIYCFTHVGGLTVSVADIRVEEQKIVVNPHANIVEYRRTRSQPVMGGMSSSRSVGYEGSLPVCLHVNQSIEVTHDDKRFTVRVVKIDYANERGLKQAYCDIEVEAIADIPGEP